jgi:hypothetical protein
VKREGKREKEGKKESWWVVLKKKFKKKKIIKIRWLWIGPPY